MEPKGSQTRPKTTFADIEFDMVFTVPNPHQEVPEEVREGTFCICFRDLSQEGSRETFLQTFMIFGPLWGPNWSPFGNIC